MVNIKFNVKQFEAAKKKVNLFFEQNPSLIKDIKIPGLHITKISIAKGFGFYGNYQQPAFFEVLEELQKNKK